MKELSLNILDITQNSVHAGAKNIKLEIFEKDSILTFTVTDDGCGMSKDFLKKVTDPFSTTRTTRKVGLGIPFLKLMAEMTGGSISIKSTSVNDDSINHGTVISATFIKSHIDCLPLGDIVSTVTTLIQGAPDIDVEYIHTLENGKTVSVDTKEMREMLGDVPLSDANVILWLSEYLKEQYEESKK